MGLTETIVLLVAALITAAISGVLGMAGGVTLISIMAAMLPAAMVVPLHGAIQMVSTGTRSITMRRYMRWKYVLALAPTMVIGVLLATRVWSGEKMGWFRPAVGVLILLFLFWRRKAPRLHNLPLWLYPFAGVGIGFLGIFVGATGPLGAPFFLRDEFTKEEIIGTQAVCLAWGHLLKIPAFISLGFNFGANWPLLLGLSVCVVGGTLIGKRILFRMPAKLFLILFEGLLGAMALYLIASRLFQAGR